MRTLYSRYGQEFLCFILCTPYFVMFPLFCTILRFWNYKIRGTYYAFRIQILDIYYKVYLKFTKHKKWEHKFKFLLPNNPLIPKRPSVDVLGLSLLKWRCSPQRIFWWNHLNDRWAFLYQLVPIRRSKKKGWSVRPKKLKADLTKSKFFPKFFKLFFKMFFTFL